MEGGVDQDRQWMKRRKEMQEARRRLAASREQKEIQSQNPPIEMLQLDIRQNNLEISTKFWKAVTSRGRKDGRNNCRRKMKPELVLFDGLPVEVKERSSVK